MRVKMANRLSAIIVAGFAMSFPSSASATVSYSLPVTFDNKSQFAIEIFNLPQMLCAGWPDAGYNIKSGQSQTNDLKSGQCITPYRTTNTYTIVFRKGDTAVEVCNIFLDIRVKESDFHGVLFPEISGGNCTSVLDISRVLDYRADCDGLDCKNKEQKLSAPGSGIKITINGY
jgi:hypothetical protein